MGKKVPDLFLKFSLGPSKVNEVKEYSRWNFRDFDFENFYPTLKRPLLTLKMYKTKVLIYLTKDY